MNSKKWLEMSTEALISLLFPLRCPVCDDLLTPEETKNGIHLACESKLFKVLGSVCMHCGRPIEKRTHEIEKNKYKKHVFESEDDDENFFCSVREYCFECMLKGYDKHSFITQSKALYLYKGAIKKTMYRFKYSNKREYARFFAAYANSRYKNWMNHIGIDVIVPVPMYKKKKRRRGYNQAESFAVELSKLMGIPVRTDLVERIIDTTPQKELDKKERLLNVDAAFRKTKEKTNYKAAMIVDDIYTTGTTAEAVARELIKQGISRVYLMAVSIGTDI